LISAAIRNEKHSVFLKNTAFLLVKKQHLFFQEKNYCNHFVTTENFSSFYPVSLYSDKHYGNLEKLSFNFSNISRHHK
jgi:hypothetical protein